MKIVVAIDSFKGSLGSLEAGMTVRDAIVSVDPTAEVVVKPLADGGEGTVEAFAAGGTAQRVTVSVCDPLRRPVLATYCIIGDTAVMEMAAAAGITLLKPTERNPMETTTYGVGQMIADAIGRGCRRFIVGIGGSATNDGGTGMLRALGYEFLDAQGAPVAFGAKGLKDLRQIRRDGVLPQLERCSFRIACDVTNPLCGALGCSAVFGPQKGATPEMIAEMDGWLRHYGLLGGAENMDVPGAGAAGGLGFGFLSFTNAKLQPGIEIVLDEIQLEADIRDADLVITGEGRLDGQTVMGKAPIGVARLAKKYGKKVVAFAGCVTEDAAACNDHGIDAFFPVLREISTLEDAMKNARKNLYATVQQVFRLISY